MKNLYHNRAFTILEATFAFAIFSTLILLGSVGVRNMGANVNEMQNIIVAEQIAKTSIEIFEDIIKNEADGVWTARSGYFSGTPKTGIFYLYFDGSSYSIKTKNDLFSDGDPINGEVDAKYEGPMNEFSDTKTENINTKFYRSFKVTELKDLGVSAANLDGGIYEIEVKICFDDCSYSEKLYKVFSR